ncbi:hypothetical protein COO60DRAFT_454237 [Scenedesmus sp. NREL 46B-D3]|nr:hypothetical protein COO60DRAFT_454237 [Scenedesmus sp. NREL 46B-D3]
MPLNSSRSSRCLFNSLAADAIVVQIWWWCRAHFAMILWLIYCSGAACLRLLAEVVVAVAYTLAQAATVSYDNFHLGIIHCSVATWCFSQQWCGGVALLWKVNLQLESGTSQQVRLHCMLGADVC